MRIGDKVRLLRGTEEGYIKAIKGNIIDVEIEEGFVIPALKNEIVIVHRRESEIFKKEPVQTTRPDFVRKILPDGLHLGIIQTTDKQHRLVFFNQSIDTILFCIYHFDKKVYNGVYMGICPGDSFIDSDKVLGSTSSGVYKIRIQLIAYQNAAKLPVTPREIDLELRIDQFRYNTYLEQIQQDVHFIPIVAPSQTIIDAVQLKESMIEGKLVPKTKDMPVKTAEQIVDLHIDKLAESLPENQIFNHQLSLFEKAFDRALASNVEKLKIIHGIGSGKLRLEIHKRLSHRKEVRFFEDADKDRFGYGATVIYF